MDTRQAIDVLEKTFLTTLLLLTPLLGAGLVVGLSVAVFQSITQIQEMTLTFIPKLLVMIFVLIVTMPWMANTLMDYTVEVFNLIISP